LEDKAEELTDCQRKTAQLTEERDTLLKQSNSTKRYLEGLPSADEHAANIRMVNTSTSLNVSQRTDNEELRNFGCGVREMENIHLLIPVLPFLLPRCM